MIVGLSHVAFRVVTPDATEARFVALGWRRLFHDDGVRIHDSERVFLLPNAPATQAITLLRHDRGWPAVELLTGRDPAPGEASPAGWRVPGADEALATLDPGVSAGPPTLAAPRLVVPPACAPLLRALGFTEAPEGVLSLRRPLPSLCLTVEVDAHASPARAARLDDPGLVVVGILTTAVVEDADAVDRACDPAPERTPPFEVAVGGRTLRLVLLRPPAGPLIELVQAA